MISSFFLPVFCRYAEDMTKYSPTSVKHLEAQQISFRERVKFAITYCFCVALSQSSPQLFAMETIERVSLDHCQSTGAYVMSGLTQVLQIIRKYFTPEVFRFAKSHSRELLSFGHHQVAYPTSLLFLRFFILLASRMCVPFQNSLLLKSARKVCLQRRL